MTHTDDLSDDLLVGASSIAAFLGWPVAAIYRPPKGLPIFKLRRKRCARKSSLVRFIEQQDGGMIAAE